MNKLPEKFNSPTYFDPKYSFLLFGRKSQLYNLCWKYIRNLEPDIRTLSIVNEISYYMTLPGILEDGWFKT